MNYTVEQIEKGEVREFDLLMALYQEAQEIREGIKNVADTIESRQKRIHS